MKKNRFTQGALPIAMASGLVVLFAGCQVAPVTNAPQQSESTVGGNKPNTVKPGTTNAQTPTQNQATGTTGTNGTTNTSTTTNPANTSTNPAAPTVAPNAKVTGRVVDANGNPIPGVQVNAVNGFKAVTDANGNYTIDVAGQDNLRLDFSKPGIVTRQSAVSVLANGTATLSPTMKVKSDTTAHINAASGGTVTSADGKAQLIIPPGALKGDADVTSTWLDPMPSDKYPSAYGELPGGMITRTLADGSQAAEDVNMSPLAFAEVAFKGNKLAPGAVATLRMKVNPEALKLAGDSVDFNNPATLQQPCYDFDRTKGMWVNPSTSKLEKDADGTVWFVYTMHGADAPKNLWGILQVVTTGNYVTGQDTIYWTETEEYVVTVGGHTEIRTRTVTRSRQVDLYGKQFAGTVKEASANAALNGQGLANATVRHETDFFGGTSKSTDSAGGFSIPMWHNTSSVSVSGASYFNANSSSGGFNMTINTDSHLNVTLGGAWDAKAGSGEAVTLTYSNDGVSKSDTANFAPTKSYTFGRDTADDMNNWALVKAESENYSWVPTTQQPAISSNLRPGDTKAITIPMTRRAPK
ncbi:MAG: hypothetical protein JWM80_6201 [Cyanobacteria bacterium RYN_339]|nr:hypothetical protein [Cyanobacteria bacterium RYN_339]